jgi:hypothetical protein
MDTKKLIRNIINDLQDLQDMTHEIALNPESSRIEAELAVTRAKLLHGEYQLLLSQLESKKAVAPAQPVATTEPIQKNKLPQEPIADNISPKREPVRPAPPIDKEEPSVKSFDLAPDDEAIVEATEELSVPDDIFDETPSNEEPETGPNVSDVPGTTKAAPPQLTEQEQPVDQTPPKKNKSEEKVFLYWDEEPDINIELDESNGAGEKSSVKSFVIDERAKAPDKPASPPPFAQSKSLNDRLAESRQADRNILTVPIQSIKSAIGLNDRFLFTRELFDNNPDKFNRAIEAIDRMHSLQEAIRFLDQHVTVSDDDTGLKFLELIRRRFTK